MLRFDLSHIMMHRGIDNPTRFLYKAGFTSSMASRLMSGQTESPNIRHISKLCRLLHCTPNDLYTYQPDGSGPLPADHPLQKLVRTETTATVAERLKTLPLEKLEALSQYIDMLNERNT